MKFGKSICLGLALAMIAQAASAADPLSARASVCMWHQHNQIMNQPAEIIRQTVSYNYENARTLLAAPQVVGSERPAFVWAMEARNACANASGFIQGGNYDATSIQKCDCFHTRMQSYL